MNFGCFSHFGKRGEGKGKELVVRRWHLKMERSWMKVESTCYLLAQARWLGVDVMYVPSAVTLAVVILPV